MHIDITTIIVTIVLNIASSLLLSPILNLWAKFSERQKKKAEEKQHVYESTVKYLMNNPQELVYLRVRSSERSLATLILLLFGLFFTSLSNGLLSLAGIIFISLANYVDIRNRNVRKLLKTIAENRRTGFPEVNLD